MGESVGVTQLTSSDWTDTHCYWSPSDDWIVFLSSGKWRTAPQSQTTSSSLFVDSGESGKLVGGGSERGGLVLGECGRTAPGLAWCWG